MFVQQYNPVTGVTEWAVVDSAGDGAETDASTALVAASSYLDMLTDKRRNWAYRMALRHELKKKGGLDPSSQSQEGGQSCIVRVLDIGTGTGLLAMLAAQGAAEVGVQAVQVTACDVFPPMARLGERLIEHNGYSDTVKVVLKRSDELVVEGSLSAEAKGNGVYVVVTDIDYRTQTQSTWSLIGPMN
eukprot:gene7498-643_t